VWGWVTWVEEVGNWSDSVANLSVSFLTVIGLDSEVSKCSDAVLPGEMGAEIA